MTTKLDVFNPIFSSENSINLLVGVVKTTNSDVGNLNANIFSTIVDKTNKLNYYLQYPRMEELPDNLKNVTYRNLIIEIIEKHFYLYNRLESWINKFGEKIIDENYYIFDTEFYLNENKIDYYFPMDIKYNLEKDLSKNFKLIFRNNIRRII